MNYSLTLGDAMLLVLVLKHINSMPLDINLVWEIHSAVSNKNLKTCGVSKRLLSFMKYAVQGMTALSSLDLLRAWTT